MSLYVDAGPFIRSSYLKQALYPGLRNSRNPCVNPYRLSFWKTGFSISNHVCDIDGDTYCCFISLCQVISFRWGALRDAPRIPNIRAVSASKMICEPISENQCKSRVGIHQGVKILLVFRAPSSGTGLMQVEREFWRLFRRLTFIGWECSYINCQHGVWYLF